MEYCINTAISSATGYSPFETLYGIKPKALWKKDEKFESEILRNREQICQDVTDAIKLSQARMLVYYNEKHSPPDLKGAVYLKVVRGTRIEYKLPHNSSLAAIEVGPFNIKRKVGNLALNWISQRASAVFTQS